MDGKDLLQGRPHGGCAFLWQVDTKAGITPIEFDSRHLCGVLIDYDNHDHGLLLINVYMPSDAAGNVQKMKEVLNEISRICEIHSTRYISIGGDFNMDFGRLLSGHTRDLQHFIRAETFKCGLTHATSDVDFTYENKMTCARSTLDHFLVSHNVFEFMEDYKVVHSGLNLSDHSSLHMSLNIPIENNVIDPPRRNVQESPGWDKATPADLSNYRNALDQHLDDIQIPLNAVGCNNLMCQIHKVEIEKFHDDIISACLLASEEYILVKRKDDKKPNGIAGWND
jgi:hypothetical protein